MTRLHITLLGVPQIELDGTEIVINRRKAIALLAYVVVNKGIQSRDRLAALLWPGYDQSTARGNLRRTLSALNRSLGDGWLEITRDTVELRRTTELAVDVVQFQHHLHACQTHDHPPGRSCSRCRKDLAQAVSLYQDDFLAGFTLADSSEFEVWQLQEAEQWRRAYGDALARLVEYDIADNALARALPYALRWLALDALNEDAHRTLMRLYAWRGDRSAALQQYAECVRLLHDEFGVQPQSETTQLRDAIAADKLVRSGEDTAQGRGEDRRVKPNLHATELSRPAQPVATAGEVRLVTVLCVGPVLSQDEESNLEWLASDAPDLLAKMEAILVACGAVVTRHLGGGVIALFGVEQMHEDDAERAIHAAFQVLEAAPAEDIGIGIGIHTGRVYVPPAGEAGTQPAVLGPVINTAARLRDMAGSGEILLTHPTYELTWLAIRTTSLSVPMPGQAEPAPMYKVTRRRRQPRRTHGIEGRRAHLVGRDREMAVLNRSLQTVQTGTGGVILLTGEAGIGKSRLVQELEEMAAHGQSSVGWLEGRCLEMTAASAYAPFVSLLRGYFAMQAGLFPASLATEIESTLQALVAANYITHDQMHEIGPLLGHLLSLRFDNAWDNALNAADPQQIQYRTYMAVKTLFAALAQQQPLVLEDLHWADDLSLDLAAELMSVASEASLLLLYVYRPVQGHRSHQLTAQAARRSPHLVHELHLHALPDSEMRTLVSALLGEVKISLALLDQILTRAQGNPFFVEEILRSLLESGALDLAGTARPVQGDTLLAPVPTTVQSVIQSRADHLSPYQRQLLQRAAVIGRTFALPLLARMVSTAGLPAALPEMLRELEERGFLYLERSLPAPEYSFWHVLTQQTVYSTLTRQERVHLHQQVAEAMEEEYAGALHEYLVELAYHYDRSDEVEKAVDYLLQAGEKLRLDYANESAIFHFQRVLERADELALAGSYPRETLDQWRYTAHMGLGRIYTHSAALTAGEAHLRKSLRLAHALHLDSSTIVQTIDDLTEVIYWRLNFEEMVALNEQALAILTDTESIEAATIYHNMWLGLASLKCMPWIGLEYIERTTQFIDKLPYVEQLRPPYFSIGTYYVNKKQPEKAIRWFHTWQQRAHDRGDLRGLGEALFHWAITHWLLGDVDAAFQTLNRMVEQMLYIGDILRTVWALSIVANWEMSVGRLASARQTLRQRYESAADPVSLEPVTAHTESILALAAGDSATAASKIDDMLTESVAKLPHRWAAGLLYQAELLLQEKQPTVARAAIEQAIRITLETPLDPPAPWYGDGIRAGQRSQLADALGKYEAASTDREQFRTQCQTWRTQYPDVAPEFTRWYLQPAPVGTDLSDPVRLLSSQRMEWLDPFSDCRYEIDGEMDAQHVVIYAANGRDLWQLNRSAPRLLLPVSGDFVLETLVYAPLDDRPAMGGLLIWQDEENYLCLNWGHRRADEISFEGNIANRDLVFGRGQLPGDQIQLRLERRGAQVHAFCRAAGEEWLTAGRTEFCVADSLQAGLYAIGQIDRLVYPGEYVDGTAIRFEQIRVAQNAPA